MSEYSGWDNQQLLAAAISGDAGATAELSSRGNTVVDDKLQKTVLGSTLINEPTIAQDDVVTITNGKITQVNGVPYP